MKMNRIEELGRNKNHSSSHMRYIHLLGWELDQQETGIRISNNGRLWLHLLANLKNYQNCITTTTSENQQIQKYRSGEQQQTTQKTQRETVISVKYI
jgi:hypothetical protein